MKEFSMFAGIDISKRTFDVVLLSASTGSRVHKCFSQSGEGYREFSEWLNKQGARKAGTLFCMEHTGLYSDGLISYLVGLNCYLWVEMAIRIKRSMGLQRVGDDKASAAIIAEYAFRFRDRVRLWKPVDTRLMQIRALLKQRERMLLSLRQLEVPVKELKECGQSCLAARLNKHQQAVSLRPSTPCFLHPNVYGKGFQWCGSSACRLLMGCVAKHLKTNEWIDAMQFAGAK